MSYRRIKNVAASTSCGCMAVAFANSHHGQLKAQALQSPVINADSTARLTKFKDINSSSTFLECTINSIFKSSIVRFGRTAATVVSIAIDYKASLWKLKDESIELEEEKHRCHLRSAKKLYNLCCTNGGIFIKVGQHLGSLDFLLPAEYVTTLKVLHSSAPQSPIENVVDMIKVELGSTVLDSFKEFDTEPLGAASLAQVHKVTLKNGLVIALKVQHKEVKSHATSDARTMEILIQFVSWLFPDFKFDWLVEETKKNLPLELNFLYEGKNCEKIGGLLAKFPFLKVPKIYWELSTEKILAMEFCEGGKVDDVDYMKQNNISCNEVSVKLGQIYSEMIFRRGFIHCDPHPGNILVRKTQQNNAEIVLLDHGLYQTLNDEFRINYCKLWQSLLEADVDAIQKHCKALNVGEMYGLLACILSGRSWDAVTSGIKHKPMTKLEAHEIQTQAIKYVPEIIAVLDRVPREMILIFKTNDLLRGIDSKLYTSDVSNSFVTMSKCCISAIFEHERSTASSINQVWSVYRSAAKDWILVYLYQFSCLPYMVRLRKTIDQCLRFLYGFRANFN